MVEPITTILIGSAVASFVAQLFKGPLDQVLSGIIPHEDPNVRLLIASYVAGAVTRDDFINASAIKQLEPKQQAMIIRYADFMRSKKEDSELVALNRGTVSELDDINKGYDKIAATANDIELDTYTLAVNNEIDKLEAERKPYELRLTKAVAKGEEGPLVEVIKKYYDAIAGMKQTIQDKRTEIINRSKEALDARLRSLPQLLTAAGKILSIPTPTEIAAAKPPIAAALEAIRSWVISLIPGAVITPAPTPAPAPTLKTSATKEELLEVAKNIMITEQMTPLPSYILAKANVESNAANLSIAEAAIKEAEAAVTPTAVPQPAAFAGPYELQYHYILNTTDVYEVKLLTDGSIEYWSKEIYDRVKAAGNISVTAAGKTAVPIVQPLTEEQLRAIENINSAAVVTAEMMQSLQPAFMGQKPMHVEPFEWSISERNNPESPPLYPYLPGTYMVTGEAGAGGDLTNVIMQFRDIMFSNGYSYGILHVYHYDAETKTWPFVKDITVYL